MGSKTVESDPDDFFGHQDEDAEALVREQDMNNLYRAHEEAGYRDGMLQINSEALQKEFERGFIDAKKASRELATSLGLINTLKLILESKINSGGSFRKFDHDLLLDLKRSENNIFEAMKKINISQGRSIVDLKTDVMITEVEQLRSTIILALTSNADSA